MSYSFTTDEHFQLAVYLSHLFQKCSLFMKVGSEYCDMQYFKYSVPINRSLMIACRQVNY